MSKTSSRRIAIVVAVAAAIVAPIAQATLHLGIDQAAFASQGDRTLRAAGYAFSIWGLIYVGLLGYAVFQATIRDSPLLRAFGWPSVVSIGSCAAWIVVSSANLRALSVAVILIGWVAAVAPLLSRPAPSRVSERVLALWPNAALAGWLTAAAALNVLTVATAEGLIASDRATAYALIGVVVVIALAALIALRSRSAIFPLPAAWGLGGVYVAEKLHQPPVAALAAAGAAVLVVLAMVVAFTGRRRR